MTYPEGLQRVKVEYDNVQHIYYITIDGKPFGRDYMSASELDEVRLFLAENVNELFTTPFNFETLQTEVKTWSEYNFDARTQVHPLIGICEEVGELCAAFLQHEEGVNKIHPAFKDVQEWDSNTWLICAFAHMGKIAHAHLKAAQGIRGTAEGHEEAKQESMSHLMTALTMYFGGGSSLSDIFDSYGIFPQNDQQVMQFDVDTPADAIGDIAGYMAAFCDSANINMQEAVETTWAKVKQRDFRLYPDNGMPPIVHNEQTGATDSTSEQTTGIQRHNENVYKQQGE